VILHLQGIRVSAHALHHSFALHCVQQIRLRHIAFTEQTSNDFTYNGRDSVP